MLNTMAPRFSAFLFLPSAFMVDYVPHPCLQETMAVFEEKERTEGVAFEPLGRYLGGDAFVTGADLEMHQDGKAPGVIAGKAFNKDRFVRYIDGKDFKTPAEAVKAAIAIDERDQQA